MKLHIRKLEEIKTTSGGPGVLNGKDFGGLVSDYAQRKLGPVGAFVKALLSL